MRRWRWLLAGVLLVGAAAGGGGWWWASRDRLPDERTGSNWAGEYVALVTSPRLLEADRQAALGFFPGATEVSRPDSAECSRSEAWVRNPPSDAFVLRQEFWLRKAEGTACSDLRVAEVMTEFRRSQGVTAAFVKRRLTKQYGLPAVWFQDDETDVTFLWQPMPGLEARLWLPKDPARFYLTITRKPGTPAAVPDEAASGRWVDQFVALVTGEALRDARGPAAAALLGSGLQPKRRQEPGECSYEYVSYLGRLPPAPFVTGLELELRAGPGETCEQARVRRVLVTVANSDFVNPPAFAKSLAARFGDPTAERGHCYSSSCFIDLEWAKPNLAAGVRTSVGYYATDEERAGHSRDFVVDVRTGF